MCAHPVSFNENVITLGSINGLQIVVRCLDVHNVFPFYPKFTQILSNLAVVLIQRGISVSFIISLKKKRPGIELHSIFKCTLLK